MFVLGAIILGVALGAVALKLVTKYWENIRDWLNNTAANVVQKYLGYDARKALQKAVCKTDRVMSKIRNRSIVYYLSSPLATHYDKVTMEATASTFDFEKEFLDAVEKEGSIMNEMDYKM